MTTQLPIPEPQRTRIKELKRMVLADRTGFIRYSHTKKYMGEVDALKEFILNSKYSADLEAVVSEVHKELNP